MNKEEAIIRLKQNKVAAEFYAGITPSNQEVENELLDIEAIDMAIEAIEALSTEVIQGDGRNNMERYPNCHMRTTLGNCDAIGGFCTSINSPICDAFHKVSRLQGDSISRSDAKDKAKEIIYSILDDTDYNDIESMAHACMMMKIKILKMFDEFPSTNVGGTI